VQEDDVTGVWVNGKKIAALGVKVRRWVTMHGLAVNVDKRSIENFNGIVPCGLEGREVCCINDFLDEPISMEDFAEHLKVALEDIFEVEIL
jgi:lipoyl(octanoyl) transferase